MRILVVQPYLAKYRVPFWEKTSEMLTARGIDLTLAVGDPLGDQSRRKDSGTLSKQISTRSSHLRLGFGVLRTQYSWRHWKSYDGVVVEASGALLDTSVAVASKRPTAVWGHLENFTGAGNPLDRAIENWQMRRADSVLAYTERGARRALVAGVENEQLFTLNNTIETDRLVARRSTMSHDEAQIHLGTVGWNRGDTFAYLGGLDASKRIDFLAEVLEILWERRSPIRILVAGSGSDEHLLTAANRRGQLKMLGHAGTETKAAMALTSAGIVMPGRVGLVAVESFAMGCPVITTDYPFHAPEFDYLVPAVDSVVTADDPNVYASRLIELSGDAETVAALQRAALAKAGWPSLELMAERFASGCVQMLNGSG